MNLGVLFSGGKDSCLALDKVREKEGVSCLITMASRNPESYMFHTPNIELTGLQAKAMGIPQIYRETEGKKEAEIGDMRDAVRDAVERYHIQGLVSGAIASEYQASRVRLVCTDLGLQSLNPIWHADQIALLREVVDRGYQVIISGVFAYPMGKEWLGRTIDAAMIAELEELEQSYRINPSGEGGEIETTVLDTPFFRQRIEVRESSTDFRLDSGTLRIERAVLVGK